MAVGFAKIIDALSYGSVDSGGSVSLVTGQDGANKAIAYNTGASDWYKFTITLPAALPEKTWYPICGYMNGHRIYTWAKNGSIYYQAPSDLRFGSTGAWSYMCGADWGTTMKGGDILEFHSYTTNEPGLGCVPPFTIDRFWLTDRSDAYEAWPGEVTPTPPTPSYIFPVGRDLSIPRRTRCRT